MTASVFAFEMLTLGPWRLAEPLGLCAAVLAVLPWIASRRRAQIAWPTLDDFPVSSGLKVRYLRHLPDLMLSLAIVCLSVALSRPQRIGGQERVKSDGIAIEFVLDRSTSMNSQDFPSGDRMDSRLSAAIRTFEAFIETRPNDLIGLVTFAGAADRLSAPTLDHKFLRDASRSIRPAGPSDAGTNMGHAIALGLGELRAVKAQRKVLILLTDGHNEPPVGTTSPPVDPEDAARLAPSFGVVLHTIAIGDGQPANRSGSGADLALLQSLANLGKGKLFLVSKQAELQQAYDEIDALEKSSLVAIVRTRYHEGYAFCIGAGLGLLLLGRWLSLGPFRLLP